jgi:hypothetical protein
MAPIIPWLGVLLGALLMYDVRTRRNRPTRASDSLSPTLRRAFQIRKVERALFFVFGMVGVTLYVWHYPERLWLPLFVVAGTAFLLSFWASVTLFTAGIDPRQLR